MKLRELIQTTGWKRALNAARITVHKNPIDKEPSDTWKAKMLLAEHSPIRLVEFDWTWDDIKQWVTVHLVRHHEGCEKFVATQREDRYSYGVPRDELPQGTENTMMMTANAQAMINISRKRLCGRASKETRAAWEAVMAALREVDPVLESKCVPECIYRGFCPEFDHCCGYCKTAEFQKRLEEYRSPEPVIKDCEHCSRNNVDLCLMPDNGKCDNFEKKND